MPPDDQPQIDKDALIQRLQADLELERRRAFENEARADNLDHQVSQSSAREHSAQLGQLQAQETAAVDAINATGSEIAGLKTKLANLQAEGKFEEAADVQEQIGDATARRQQAMQAKAYFAQQRSNYSAAPADPVERFLADNSNTYSKEDMDWIRHNRRFATDAAFRNRVIQAHADALQQGIRQRSPEYYSHIENVAYLRPAPLAEQPQTQPAPSGYEAESEEPQEPEIRIREPEMIQQSNEAFNRRANQPQTSAAGNGSLKAAIAGAPSRRSPTAMDRRTIAELSEQERDTAMAMAPHLAPPEVLQGGEPAILNWYNDGKDSATARRIRQGWQERR